MVDIPLPSRTQVGPGTTGITKPPLALADRSGQIELGQSIQQLGGDLFQRLTLAKAANEQATFKGVKDTEIQAYGAYVEQHPNASEEELKKRQELMMTNIETAAGRATTGIAKRSNANWFAENKSLIKQKAQDQMVAIRTRQEIIKYQLLQKANIQNLDAPAYEKLKDEMVAANFLDAGIADAQEKLDMAIIDKAMDKIEVDNIKPALIAAMGEGLDKEAGLETLASELSRLKKEGVLSEAEAAQEDKVLGDWMVSYIVGRRKRAADAIKLTTRETYDTFNVSIQEGTLTYDDIAEAKGIDAATKELWQGYLKGSYTDPPKVSTPEASSQANKAVFDSMSLELSPTEAFDKLLKLRYTEKKITDEQFNWGVSKIENPYKKHVLEDLKSTMNVNDTDFNEFGPLHLFSGPSDKRKSRDVNDALISWLDDLIEKDAVPQFDLKKKMAAVSAQIRHGKTSLTDIGDTITTEEGEWEVVGYYPDGEPSYERVE